MKSVLIVEDESLVSLEISGFVKSIGYEVGGIATSANEAIAIFTNSNIDAVLMDVYIKGSIDGIECANIIKDIKDVPIIYISAFSDDATLERAIKTEPSSYLVKPFNRSELKIALLIATKTTDAQTNKGDIELDEEFSFSSKNNELIHRGEVVHLTKREKELLSLLIKNKNNVINFYNIELELWPDKVANENTRRALVSKLRAKLNYKFIQTVHSIGYKLTI